MNQPALQNQTEYILTVQTGPDKGAVYKIVSGRVQIGRGSQNDIVIQGDTKCSRHHALIEITAGGVEITDISEQNKVILNGRKIKKALLSPMSIIQLGNTKIEFQVQANDPSQQRHLSLAKDKSGRGSLDAHHASPIQGHASPRSQKPSSNQTKNIIYTVIILSVFIFVWIGGESSKNDTSEINFVSDSEFNADISERLTRTSEELQRREAEGQNTRQYRDAQSFFIRGSRDMRNGQYQRAIEHFQSCLVLFPSHKLCQLYMIESQKTLRDLIERKMQLGRQYLSQHHFSACEMEFRSAMFLIRDRNDRLYKEAEAYRKECELRKGGLF